MQQMDMQELRESWSVFWLAPDLGLPSCNRNALLLGSVPLVAITCNVGVSLLGKDSFQEIDITGITMPITKHNYIVKDVNDLADTIRKAFDIARSGRPGPVLI